MGMLFLLIANFLILDNMLVRRVALLTIEAFYVHNSRFRNRRTY